MKKLWALCACICLVGPAYADGAKSLKLNEALQMALDASPTLKGAQADYNAAQGERRQASALINPAFTFQAENIGGSGAYKGMNEAELTIGLEQTVEIGGKRSARIKAADHGKMRADYAQKSAALDLVRDVKIAFFNAVTAQEEAQLAIEQAKLARDVYQTVNKRVQAAAAPIMQRNKAKILMANADLVAAQSKGKKEAALKMLGAFWNTAHVSSIDTGDFYTIEKPVSNTDIQKALRNTVDYKQKSINMEQARSLFDQEQANAFPDPTFGIGVRELRNTNDQAIIASVSFPLPVFNMNKGNIDKARHMVTKADADRQKLLLDGQIGLTERYQRLQNAWLAASTIKSSILPEAQEAFKQSQRGYNAGKFPYLEVLDAQRTLVETRLTYIQALQNYHIEKAAIDRVTAQDTATGDAR